MRRVVTLLVGCSVTLGLAACLPSPDGNKSLLAQPKGYDPVGGDLTFNKDRLRAFVMMDEPERAAFVEDLKSKTGTFSGMGIFVSGAELTEVVPDHIYGEWELSATTETIVFDVSVDYAVFCPLSMCKAGFPPHRAIAFKGTLVDLSYDAEAKPRVVKVKVKADSVELIKD